MLKEQAVPDNDICSVIITVDNDDKDDGVANIMPVMYPEACFFKDAACS